MPTPPYAQIRISVDGGAPQSGGIDCVGGEEIQLSAPSTSHWKTARWEIYAPSGYATPAGWSLDALTGAIYYVGFTPPPFTLSLAAVLFGKYMLRLIVNGATVDRNAPSFNADLVDELSAIRVKSATGINGVGFRESTQFDAKRTWSGQLDDDIKRLAELSDGGPPGGVSGDIQTNDGAGGFAALTPDTGVATWIEDASQLPPVASFESTVAGSAKSRSREPVSVATNDDTETTLDSFTIASGVAVTVTWTVTAASGSSASAGWVVSAHLQNDGVMGPALRGTPMVTPIGTPSDPAWAVTVDANGLDTVRLRVTGAPATAITWGAAGMALEV